MGTPREIHVVYVSEALGQKLEPGIDPSLRWQVKDAFDGKVLTHCATENEAIDFAMKTARRLRAGGKHVVDVLLFDVNGVRRAPDTRRT